MVHKTVQNGCCQLLVVKYCVPFIKGQVGRNDHTPFLVAFRDSLKQQLGADSLEGDITPLVQDQDIGQVQFFQNFVS